MHMRTAHDNTTPTNLYLFAELHKQGPTGSKETGNQFGMA